MSDPEMKAVKANNRAMIIGIDHYSHRDINSLLYATKDALDVFDSLRQFCGYCEDRIDVLVTEPSQGATDEDSTLQDRFSKVNRNDRIPHRSNVIGVLEDIISSEEPIDNFVFYFAGHGKYFGDVLEDGPLASNRLVFMDGRDRKDGEMDGTLTLQKLKDTYLSRVKAKVKILLIDACHGSFTRGDEQDNNMAEQFEDALLQMVESGWAVLSACTKGEVSHEHRFSEGGNGVFTRYLIRGIQGEAYRGAGEGMIYLEDLKIYVMEEMRKFNAQQGRKQTPAFFANLTENIAMSEAFREPQQPVEIATQELRAIVNDIREMVTLSQAETSTRNNQEEHAELAARELRALVQEIRKMTPQSQEEESARGDQEESEMRENDRESSFLGAVFSRDSVVRFALPLLLALLLLVMLYREISGIMGGA